MLFEVIVCDCPWQANDSLTMDKTKRGAGANYNTISTKDLCKLPVSSIANPDGCLLASWVLGSMLEDGIEVFNAWGFNLKQTYVWVKTKKHLENISIDDCLAFGLGRLFRQTHEICLIGTNSNNIYKLLNNKSQRSVSFKENKRHSTKPENLQNSLDLMFPTAQKIELFARRERPGWICLGNDSSLSLSSDISVGLGKISKIQDPSFIQYDKTAKKNIWDNM